MDTLSVVVPVFNSEKYLEQCIDSIVNQSYANLDIILVDNASTDNSLKICSSYAEKDSRIRIIRNIDNFGPQYARFKGVECARGKYVTFVDSDDWLDILLYEKVLEKLDDSDLIEYGYSKVFGNSLEENRPVLEQGSYSSDEQLEYIFSKMMFSEKSGNRPAIAQYLWSKIYKKHIIQDIADELCMTSSYGEDQECIYKYVLKCQKITIVNYVGYYYRQHNHSIVHSGNPSRLKDIGVLYESLYDTFTSHRLKAKLLLQLQKRIVNILIDGISSDSFGFVPEAKVPLYLLPSISFKGKRVVLYSAGSVGKDFYRQLVTQDRSALVKWVDINYTEYRNRGYEVDPVESIKNVDYDIILIAVLHESLFEEIRESLCKMGIKKNKIMWGEPRRLI